jgi:hypothetical protein
VATVAGAPWWIVAPAAAFSAASGLLALGGRTAELWRRIEKIRIRDKAMLGVIERNSARLSDPNLSPEERQLLLGEITALHGLLGE